MTEHPSEASGAPVATAPAHAAATTPADALAATMRRAISAGLLPPQAQAQAASSRPWPVVLLTALGAWLAALPLLAVVGLLLEPLVQTRGGPYLVAALVLAGAVSVLRTRAPQVFLEQLAIPALLVGLGALGFGAFRDLSPSAAALLLALAALLLALALPPPWLRVLLGSAAAALVALALLRLHADWEQAFMIDRQWAIWHAMVLLWLLALALLDTGLAGGARVRSAAALESIAAGWLLLTLAALALLAGMTLLVGGVLGTRFITSGTDGGHDAGSVVWQQLRPAASALLAALAAAWAAWRWHELRRAPLALAALVLAGLAWLQPVLGALLVALSVTATTQRWRQAGAATCAAAWALGAYYYALGLPLAHKGALLCVAGAVLAALAWWLAKHGEAEVRPTNNAQATATTASDTANPQHARALSPRVLSALTMLSVLATLLVAGVGIGQKEELIAHGQRVLVALAPVDPRSLMQGDYMRLNFRLPPAVEHLGGPTPAAKRPHVVALRGADHVAILLRLHQAGQALAPDEFLFELTARNGRWGLVTDAWFFAEGEGEVWAQARYGEFRVAPNGRALLVGLADGQGRRIEPAASHLTHP